MKIPPLKMYTFTNHFEHPCMTFIIHLKNQELKKKVYKKKFWS